MKSSEGPFHLPLCHLLWDLLIGPLTGRRREKGRKATTVAAPGPACPLVTHVLPADALGKAPPRHAGCREN